MDHDFPIFVSQSTWDTRPGKHDQKTNWKDPQKAISMGQLTNYMVDLSIVFHSYVGTQLGIPSGKLT